MNASLFPICLLLPFSTVLLSAGGGEGAVSRVEEEENVSRFYDLSSLTAEPSENEERVFRLAAHVDPRHISGMPGQDDTLDYLRGADDVVNLLVDLLAGEFEYEGRSIQAVEGARILVRGPEGLHRRVQEVLAFFDELANAQMELTVNVVPLEATVEPPFGGRAILPRAEVERWLGTLAQNPGSQEFRLNLRADQPAEIDLTRSHSVLVDYDVEIAQAATIGDPISVFLAVGTFAYVHATPAPEGVALSVVFKRGDLLGEVRERSLRMSSEVRTDGGMINTPPCTVFQTYDLVGRSYAFNALLQPDTAIVLHHRIDMSRDRRNEVVVMRWTGGELPWRRSLKLPEPVNQVVAANLRFVAPPSLKADGTMLNTMSLPHNLLQWISSSDESYLLGVHLEKYSTDYALELVSSQAESMNIVGYKNFSLFRHWDSQGSAAEADKQIAAVNAALDGLKQNERMIEVNAKLTRLGKWAGAPVQVTVPMRMNHSCALSLGIENPIALDYDVEVAQDASVSDAQIFAEFEGLVLWIRPSRSPRGDLILDLCAGASQIVTPRHVLDLGRFDIEQSTMDHLFSRERLTIAANQRGPTTIVLGDRSSGKGSDGSLRLELSITQ